MGSSTTPENPTWYLDYEKALRPSATLSTDPKRSKRLVQEDLPFSYRTEFQHDRDRIVHSRAFRRLQQKTQVVPSWTSDHVRTRLTHTMEVSQIARSICAALGLNTCLAEAIALGHDVGHTPFGHGGEQTLHLIMSGDDDLGGRLAQLIKRTHIRHKSQHNTRPAVFGGFKHNWNSLRLLSGEDRYAGFRGLNLTTATREGILKHTGLKSRVAPHDVWDDELKLGFSLKDVPSTLEGQVVALADEIAQATHDLEDGFRTGIVNMPEFMARLPVFRAAGFVDEDGKSLLDWNDARQRGRNIALVIRSLIGRFTNDTIAHSDEQIGLWEAKGGRVPMKRYIGFSKQTGEQFSDLHKALHDCFVNSGYVNRLDGKAKFFICRLFEAYWDNPRQLPDFVLRRYSELSGQPYLRNVTLAEIQQHIATYHDDVRFLRLTCDHVAAMSDRYVLSEYAELYEPNTHGQHHPEGFR